MDKPDDEFWSVFPSNFPTKVCSKVDASKLETLVQEHEVSWTEVEKRTARKAIKR
jgi:hypothetical protein